MKIIIENRLQAVREIYEDAAIIAIGTAQELAFTDRADYQGAPDECFVCLASNVGAQAYSLRKYKVRVM